jgi:hypothetical protein
MCVLSESRFLNESRSRLGGLKAHISWNAIHIPSDHENLKQDRSEHLKLSIASEQQLQWKGKSFSFRRFLDRSLKTIPVNFI